MGRKKASIVIPRKKSFTPVRNPYHKVTRADVSKLEDLRESEERSEIEELMFGVPELEDLDLEGD